MTSDGRSPREQATPQTQCVKIDLALITCCLRNVWNYSARVSDGKASESFRQPSFCFGERGLPARPLRRVYFRVHPASLRVCGPSVIPSSRPRIRAFRMLLLDNGLPFEFRTPM